MKNIDIIYTRHHTDARATKIFPASIRYYDLTLSLKGSLYYKINGAPVVLTQGDVLCLPPGSARERDEGEERSDFISFNFLCTDEIALPIKIEKAIGNDTLLLIAAYDELCRHPYLDNKEKTTHLLSCILLILEDKVKQTKYNPLTLTVIEYIHANLDKKITLDDIGRATFFSAGYCDTIFKKETGRSIIDYLLEARVTEAKKMLVEGSIPLSTVSELVGFDDYNYFSRVFKKRTGYTPTEYRRFREQ